MVSGGPGEDVASYGRRTAPVRVMLPNTAELLTEVHKLAESKNLAIGCKLADAYRFSYPEGEDVELVADQAYAKAADRILEDVRPRP